MGSSPQTRRKILVIDDEEPILLLLQTVLNVYGYEAIKAPSPEQAFARIAEDLPDLIILDVSMPEMNGYEVCRKIKSNPETKDIPIIMITALALEQDRKQALQAGANGFLFKPFDPKVVIKAIESLLNPASEPTLKQA